MLGGDEVIYVYDLNSNKRKFKFEGHTDNVKGSGKGVIKDNIADIFKNQHGSLDNDGLENVLDLFDNAE